MVEKVIKEFDITNIPRSCTFIVIGPPQSGKTSFIEQLLYFNQHKYPCAKVWCETEDTQRNYQKYIPPLYISNEYNISEHDNSIVRQKMTLNDKECSNPSCAFVLDDCNTDKQIFRTKQMIGQFKNGSRWWDCLFIIGSHYIFDMGPDLRNSVSYVVLFREPSMDERKKLWKNFAIGCNFAEFCDLMDQLTGHFCCMIFQKRSQSNNLEDCCFYYQVKDPKTLGKWKIGCKQYRKWAKSRYNKQYKEVF